MTKANGHLKPDNEQLHYTNFLEALKKLKSDIDFMDDQLLLLAEQTLDAKDYEQFQHDLKVIREMGISNAGVV